MKTNAADGRVMELVSPRAVRLSLLLAVFSVAGRADARPAPKSEGAAATIPPGVVVPDPLKPWTGWVLHGKEDALCPTLHGGEQEEGECAWPARLSLSLDGKGGKFTQQWRVHTKSIVPLPGEEKRWPQDVRVDGKPAVVVTSEDDESTPAVMLAPGDHTVSGAFFWDEMPESLDVPSQTGLLSLSVQGKEVALPSRDGEGKVYLHKQAAQVEADVLEATVHRRVDDDIPLLVTTRVELRVAGKSREVALGRALPEGFVPMSLDSPLPARVEADSRLRVQVRPGTWVLTLVARHADPEGTVAAIARPKPEGPWAEGDEVWVFDARPALRTVTIEGVNAIDPQQTTLPDDWKRLPAYPMKLGDSFKLVEQRRGDSDPAPDQLSLARQLWLDFDGGGYTITDTLTGQLHRAFRLEVNPPTVLGRVAVGGKDQFITRVKGSAPGSKDGTAEPARAGVEIRQGSVAVSADSRIVGGVGNIPAVSWDADFQHVEATLRLPPGWRLLHAEGADEVPGTWIRHWTLLDLFLVLIIAMAIARLYGPLWGVLALVTLVLVFPEDGGPTWVWLPLLAIEALHRVLPSGRLSLVLKVFRVAARVALALVVISFAAQHVRSAMYPALEHDGGGGGSSLGFALKSNAQAMAPGAPSGSPNAPPPIAGEAAARDEDTDRDKRVEDGKGDSKELGGLGSIGRGPGGGGTYSGKVAKKMSWQATQQYDPNAMVQTGPGLPQWDWTSVSLRWSGPVERTQRLHLVLVPPWANLVLAWLRVLLLAVLVLRLLEPPSRFLPGMLRASFGGSGPAVTALTLVVMMLAPSLGRAQLPSKEMLDELRERLLEKPACRPHCASSPRLALDVEARSLRARMEVDAAAATAVALPGKADQWAPEQVILDGKPAPALLRSSDGLLWLEVSEGNHQILLEGRLPARDTVQIALPMKSHRVEAKVAGWTLDGLHEDGIADDDLQLTRIRGQGDTESASSLQPGSLPPFVRVVRELHLGLQWEVDTHVIRATPTGSAVVVEVPLLPGESVTTADVRVQGGKAQVNMGPSALDVSWHSLLAQRSPIKLTAPRAATWMEEWRLDASPIWHVELEGIPVVHQPDDTGLRVPWWRPFPGESVTVDVARPEGVAGQTLTIDRSVLQIAPGLRASDVTLTIDVRSSRGTQHVITLPESATLQSVSIDGRTQPIRQDKRTVTLPLVPGRQTVALTWRETDPLRLSFRTPEVDLGAPSVNAEIKVDLPDDRWTLLCGGPRLGPAVLFWSMLLVLIVVAIALGQIKTTPLRIEQWLLLGLGLSQVPLPAAAIVAGWLLLLGLRERDPLPPLLVERAVLFNFRQVVLIAWTAVALVVLVGAIHEGLLGEPDMQIAGNGSSSSCLRWFADRSDGILPRAWVLSVPLMAYRVAMLLWALWIARALLGWLRWGWRAINAGGFWKRTPPTTNATSREASPPPQPPASPPASP